MNLFEIRFLFILVQIVLTILTRQKTKANIVPINGRICLSDNQIRSNAERVVGGDATTHCGEPLSDVHRNKRLGKLHPASPTTRAHQDMLCAFCAVPIAPIFWTQRNVDKRTMITLDSEMKNITDSTMHNMTLN